MKTNLLKLPGVVLLTRQQLKTIKGSRIANSSIAGDGGSCNDKCTGDYDCGGVNKYCSSYYCNPDGTGGSFKQCSPT